MKSLNFAVETGLGLLIAAEEVKIEYALCEDLPSFYDSTQIGQIREGLARLTEEILRHGNCSRVKASTEKDSSAQRVLLAWNGNQLTDDLVAQLNDLYAEGARSAFLGERHGSRMAGYWFSFVNGRVKIENHEDGIYRVRNVVELPLNIPN